MCVQVNERANSDITFINQVHLLFECMDTTIDIIKLRLLCVLWRAIWRVCGTRVPTSKCNRVCHEERTREKKTIFM